uniref:Uncharacterized protein n=1 Tax=Arundo donax TaxID=35708 RepID=A0A0A9BAK1_ARUDO
MLVQARLFVGYVSFCRNEQLSQNFCFESISEISNQYVSCTI